MSKKSKIHQKSKISECVQKSKAFSTFGNLKIFKKFSNNKKSIELAMNTIVIAMIVLIVALIIIFMFRHYYGKETGFVGEQINQLDDYDGDGTANMFDKCPCDPNKEDNCKDKKICEEEMKNYYKTKK